MSTMTTTPAPVKTAYLVCPSCDGSGRHDGPAPCPCCCGRGTATLAMVALYYRACRPAEPPRDWHTDEPTPIEVLMDQAPYDEECPPPTWDELYAHRRQEQTYAGGFGHPAQEDW